MMTHSLCPFFKICGGCLYQDLPEDAYLKKKQTFIVRAFADHGITVTPEAIRQIPIESRRRATFAFSNGHVGYNALKSHRIVDITECRLLKPDILHFLPTLRQWIQQLGGRGDVSVLATNSGLDIHIKTSQPVKPDLKRLEQLAVMASDPAVVRLSYNGTPIVSKLPLPFPPDSFLQPSQEGEEELVRLLLEQTQGIKKAVDLFCGGGTFTKPLLSQGIRAIGYDCAENVRTLGVSGRVRDLFRSPVPAEELNDADLIILDPPRAGAKAQTEQIALTTVPKIVMISCNPATAARDAAVLINAGWHLTRVVPVDQFTWSNHIEIFCVFEK